MSKTTSTQIGNKPGGDLVARDKHATTVNIHKYGSRRTHISILNDKYLQEMRGETEIFEYIQILMHYVDSPEDDVRGLEDKLRSALRDRNYIEEAKKYKELFAKRFIKRDLSPSAQKIFAYLLGKIKQSFRHKIIPSIKNGIDHNTIEEMIFSDVIEPIYEGLEENVLDITWDEFIGMLYFLTGNCHLRWDWDQDANI